MKRQHTKSESYIDWLKSLGCLVYLPLSADGDLQDRISGLSLQLTGQGSMIWDNAQQMHKITHPSSTLFAYVASLENGLNVNWFPNDNFTVLHTLKRITNSSSKFMNTFSPRSNDATTCAATSGMWNGTGRTNGFPSTVVNIGWVIDRTNQKSVVVQNGSIYSTAGDRPDYAPSGWIMNGTGITIACNRITQCYSTQYYMKEIYLFSTALDLTTIRKIQGYE